MLRVAIEHASVDVLQWLIAANDAAAWAGVPLIMPHDSGCAAAATHRALEAALRDGYRQRQLVQVTIDSAAEAVHDMEERERERAAGSGSGSGNVPTGLPVSLAQTAAGVGGRGGPSGVASDEGECVVCMAAPREVVLLGCGHVCACEQCAGMLRDCPLCRGPIDRVVRLFGLPAAGHGPNA